MSLSAICAADLHQNEIFDGLSERQLEWLVEHGTCIELETGGSLWTEGEPAEAMFIVLQGMLQMYFDIAGQTLQIDSSWRSGVTGMLPFSRMTEYSGKNRATEPTRVLRIGREHFSEMLVQIPELGYRLVAILSDRVRDSTRVAEQREKMMALGKLAAGLSHELNNPAAAVKRAADELSQRLQASNALVARLAEHRLEPEQMQSVAALRELGRPGATEGKLSPLERSDREDELGDWLDEQGVEDAWMLAEAFVDAGVELSAIQDRCSCLPQSAVADAVAWIGSGVAARQLLSQVTEASGRISELVASVKNYSHMDQNPDKSPADIHQGIDSTLTMLGHKMKGKDVELQREYASEMPLLSLQVSEINQVWTNLIDNAVDAMDAGGKLEIRTEHDGCSAFVRVIDNGGGISEEHRARIFDPFYTTKAVGEGTGLGLDIVQRIVVQHEGEINVESEPGRTEFTVRLPLASD
ncbi:MAG: ATP-binding protein [Acidobacteriota bacterium]